MTEEEKKAIEKLTKKMQFHKDKPSGTYAWLTLDEHNLRLLLNLVEKQQKEIEEYKETINSLKPNLKELIEMSNFAMQKDYISKDKIIEKIKHYEKCIETENWGEKTKLGYNNRIIALKELLGEEDE